MEHYTFGTNLNAKGLSQEQRNKIAAVAELYWVRGLKVEAVGRELGISRSTVSRMLAQARAEHIIEFIVHREHNDADSLRRALEVKYDIDVAVANVSGQVSDVSRRMTVGREAAMWLGALIKPNSVITVAWGGTVEAVSSQLRYRKVPGVQIVQMHGSGNVASLGKNYASQILERFGAAFEAQVHLFPVPAVFDSAATLQAMWQETSIRQVLELRGKTSILVSSIGTPVGKAPGRLYASGYLSSDDMQELERTAAVGNIASVFFREDGSTDGISINQRSTGMSFAEIREVPTRLFVVDDPVKARAAHAALRAGLVTHLVVDPVTARAILDA